MSAATLALVSLEAGPEPEVVSTAGGNSGLAAAQLPLLQELPVRNLLKLNFPDPADPGDVWVVTTRDGQRWIDRYTGKVLAWRGVTPAGRLYDWAVVLHTGESAWPWAVVLGAAGVIREDVNEETCRQDAVPVGRRSSGGGTVLLGPGCCLYSLVLAYDKLSVIAATVILCGVLYLFFNKTTLGTAMRASSENMLAAYYMGIPVKRVVSIVWAISAAVATCAGVLLAPITFVHSNVGLALGLKAFPAAVLGGERVAVGQRGDQRRHRRVRDGGRRTRRCRVTGRRR